MSQFPIVLAARWFRASYPHERVDIPCLCLVRFGEDWICDGCGREGRLWRVFGAGAASCPRCHSPFVLPLSEAHGGPQIHDPVFVRAWKRTLSCPTSNC